MDLPAAAAWGEEAARGTSHTHGEGRRRPMIESRGVFVLVRLREQAALCIVKELWAPRGEMYDCHISCGGRGGRRNSDKRDNGRR